VWVPERSGRTPHRSSRSKRRDSCCKARETRDGHHPNRPRDRLDGGGTTTRHIVRLSAIGQVEQLATGAGGGGVE
jgi:hypothetical protein